MIKKENWQLFDCQFLNFPFFTSQKEQQKKEFACSLKMNMNFPRQQIGKNWEQMEKQYFINSFIVEFIQILYTQQLDIYQLLKDLKYTSLQLKIQRTFSVWQIQCKSVQIYTSRRLLQDIQLWQSHLV